MLIPIKHENMTARRWPVATLALITITVVVFLFTLSAMDDEAPQLGEVKSHILILAALHPELKMQTESQQLVDGFKQSHPEQWKQVQNLHRDIIDAYDAKIKMTEDPSKLQDEMDSLNVQFVKLSATSITEQYAFVPAHPRAISYLTANFLHGGWLHLIGNMWFLWLAGFVLEDVWGRALYLAFYLMGGAAALQFHAWANPDSIIPCVGASGAVAALMGAFLTRFPKMKIEMLWIFGFFRTYRFKASAYWLLPLWVLMEVFYGSLFGKTSGTAHWAHVGGFIFGALGAVALRYTGFENRVNEKVEKQLTWTCDPEIDRANQLVETGQMNEAVAVAQQHLSTNPNSLDGWNLLRQVYWRRNELPAYHEATAKACELQLRANNPEGAWRDYEDLKNSGGEKLPVAPWLGICRL